MRRFEDESRREERGRRSSREELPAALQDGFEAWLRASLATRLADASPSAFGLLPRSAIVSRTGSISVASNVTLDAAGLAPAFSTTNVQEAGVDEADAVKSDGEFLYVAPAASRWVGAGGTPAVAIRVLRIGDDPARAEEIGAIEVPDAASVSGLYLLGSAGRRDARLLVLGSRFSVAPRDPWPYPWDWGQIRTTLHVFDVRDPSAAREVWSLALDGDLVGSRRIDETLHLVTRAQPAFAVRGAGGVATAETDPEAWGRVVTARAADLLPRVVVDGGTPEPQVDPDRCLLGIHEPHAMYYPPAIVTITSIDLRRPRRLGSLCVGGLPDRTYSSIGAFYLGVRAGASTVIHRFGYSSRGPRYRGAGIAKGFVVGPQSGFSLGEHAGVLGVVTDQSPSVFGGNAFVPVILPRPIVTLRPAPIALPSVTIGSPTLGPIVSVDLAQRLDAIASVVPMPDPAPLPGEPPGATGSDEPDRGRYRLTLLRESPGERFALEEVAHLPNDAEPEPIGKPGDFIHGVRFVGDRLYVVTYRKVDPLYAIDLADPEFPRIAGQLEVPGFSDYLHPIGSDLLLGVGFDTWPDERNDWFQGIKVELFDVSDPAALVSLDAITVGRRGSQSSALADHHAIAHLPVRDGVHRFAVPIEVHDRDSLPGDLPTTYFPWLHTGLHLFEVEGMHGGAAARLRALGAVIATAASDPDAATPGTYGDRSVIQRGAVHYVHGGSVWSAPWDAPEDAVGPQ